MSTEIVVARRLVDSAQAPIGNFTKHPRRKDSFFFVASQFSESVFRVPFKVHVVFEAKKGVLFHVLQIH